LIPDLVRAKRNPTEKGIFMLQKVAAAVLSAISIVAVAQAETLVIQEKTADHEATIRVPASAVSSVASNVSEPLPENANSRIEATRLVGNVLINLRGTDGPITIKADRVILELTPTLQTTMSQDGACAVCGNTKAHSKSDQVMKSDQINVNEHSVSLVGNAVLNGETITGPFEIKADTLIRDFD
jgi:lipopolysaccharide export system protein LptA